MTSLKPILIFLFSLLLAATTQAGTIVQFRTTLGEFEVELYDQDKPETVKNFLRYIATGRFQDSFVQRWEPRFVIQAGGYTVTNRNKTTADFAVVQTFGNITNEYSVGRTFSNTYGTLAMARASGQINSASSQWFVNLTNNAFLDRVDSGFTVFGTVTKGTNVLERFNNTSLTNSIFRLALGGALNTLPVVSQSPTFNDLIYLDISLLRISAEPAPGGGVQIAWDSVTNAVHRVQFTTVLPPVWQALTQTNGTGGRLVVHDPAGSTTQRFYRVTTGNN